MDPLPEGLVTSTSDPYPSASPGLVDVADIARLWRVFNTNPRIHPGTVGHRLENLFWRIWSSGRLLCSLDGATLARLFELIAEDQPSHVAQLIDKHKTAEPRPPPPILKKNQPSHSELPKTTRLLLTSPEGQNFTRNPSNPPTPILAAPAATQATPTAAAAPAPPGKDEMPKHKKMLFVASTTTRAVKRRPARRSARSARLHSPPSPSPSPSLSPPSPAQHPSPLGSEGWVDLPDGEGEELPEVTTAEDAKAKPHLPPSFVANLRAHMKAHPVRTTAAAPTTAAVDPQASDAELRYSWYRQPTKTALVDRDFRSRFAEQVVEARAVQAAQVAESGSSSSSSSSSESVGGGLDTRQGQGCCQSQVHGLAVSGSFDDGLTMASGSCAVLTDAGSSAGVHARSFNPTPGSNEVSSSYCPVAGEAGTPSSGSQIRMDISFEELEELSPMVW
ncbi:hypothetical protein PHISP_02867 [Aspergillus sp. HF37]|nr:hypothetical protein PHISP_02867 [Aspergillus sp. HF37]